MSASLWDAYYLLQKAEHTLKVAAAKWWWNQVQLHDLLECATELQTAFQHLEDTEVEMDPTLLDRCGNWGTGKASADDLLSDRDAVVATMAVIRFVLDRDGADQDVQPESPSGGPGWDRVRLPRARVPKVQGAG